MLTISPHEFCWGSSDQMLLQENLSYFCPEEMGDYAAASVHHLCSPPSSNCNNSNDNIDKGGAMRKSSSCEEEGFLFPGEDEDDDAKSCDRVNKKLNHNASERDRRKRINTLYASLRSLLPPHHQSKKLSIPATVSRVLKYIPELQKEVDNLIRQKETLISRINNSKGSGSPNKKRKLDDRCSSSSSAAAAAAVSATTINPNEMIAQWSVPKTSHNPFLLLFSQTLHTFEDVGFLVLNASSFQSFQDRVFFNLHLKAQRDDVVMDEEMLKEKILSICDTQNKLQHLPLIH